MRITRRVRASKSLVSNSSPVNLVIVYSTQRFEIFTGEYATPKNWDAKRKVFKSDSLAVFMNRQLDNLENLIKEVWYELILTTNIPEVVHFKQAIDKRRYPDKYATQYLPPLEFITKFAEDHKTQLSQNFLRKASSTAAHLRSYQSTIKWSDLRLEFWNGLTSHLYSKGMSPGGIEAYYKFIRSVCRYALRLDYPVSRDFELIKVSAIPTQKITLTQDEVNRILHMRQQEPYGENVRGKFLFLIFTGMRFSDLQRMGDGNIVQSNGFRLLRYTQVKTKEVVTIALSDYAEEIIDRFPDLFSPISEQKFNTKVKDVCKEARINELVNITTYKGGQRLQEQKPKWQVVTSHVGRHTHGVLSIERGLHTRLLQDNFGHGSLASTQVYTKVNDLERHKATLQAWKRPENEVAE